MSRVTDLLGEAPAKPKAPQQSIYTRAIITRMLAGVADYSASGDPLGDMLNDLCGLCGMTYTQCAKALTLRFGVEVKPMAVSNWVNTTQGLGARIAASRVRIEKNLEGRKRALGGDGRRDWQYWIKAAARGTRRSHKAARRHCSLMRGYDPRSGGPVDRGDRDPNSSE